jgi:hypothetical protein
MPCPSHPPLLDKYGDKIKEKKLGGTNTDNRRAEKFVQICDRKYLKEISHLGELSVDVMMILTFTFKTMWTEFFWLRIRISEHCI